MVGQENSRLVRRHLERADVRSSTHCDQFTCCWLAAVLVGQTSQTNASRLYQLAPSPETPPPKQCRHQVIWRLFYRYCIVLASTPTYSVVPFGTDCFSRHMMNECLIVPNGKETPVCRHDSDERSFTFLKCFAYPQRPLPMTPILSQICLLTRTTSVRFLGLGFSKFTQAHRHLPYLTCWNRDLGSPFYMTNRETTL
jgi:hypothetical protein